MIMDNNNNVNKFNDYMGNKTSNTNVTGKISNISDSTANFKIENVNTISNPSVSSTSKQSFNANRTVEQIDLSANSLNVKDPGLPNPVDDIHKYGDYDGPVLEDINGNILSPKKSNNTISQSNNQTPTNNTNGQAIKGYDKSGAQIIDEEEGTVIEDDDPVFYYNGDNTNSNFTNPIGSSANKNEQGVTEFFYDEDDDSNKNSTELNDALEKYKVNNDDFYNYVSNNHKDVYGYFNDNNKIFTGEFNYEDVVRTFNNGTNNDYSDEEIYYPESKDINQIKNPTFDIEDEWNLNGSGDNDNDIVLDINDIEGELENDGPYLEPSNGNSNYNTNNNFNYNNNNNGASIQKNSSNWNNTYSGDGYGYSISFDNRTYTPYEQWAGKYANEFYGYDSYGQAQTFQSYGGGITTLATVLSGHGNNMNPKELNQFLQNTMSNYNSYNMGSYEQMEAQIKACNFDSWRFDASTLSTETNVNMLRDHIKSGGEAIFIVKDTVNYDNGGHNYDGGNSHWISVLGISDDGKKVYVADSGRVNSGGSEYGDGWVSIEKLFTESKPEDYFLVMDKKISSDSYDPGAAYGLGNIHSIQNSNNEFTYSTNNDYNNNEFTYNSNNDYSNNNNSNNNTYSNNYSYSNNGVRDYNASGDGYAYSISFNGRKYNAYEQWTGSYANMPYEYSTFSSYGCGITNVAIIASGHGETRNPLELHEEFPRSDIGTYDQVSYLFDKLGFTVDYCSYGNWFDDDKMVDDIRRTLQNGGEAMVVYEGQIQYSNGYASYRTKGGAHWISIVGISDDGKEVYIIDPGSGEGENGDGWAPIENIKYCSSYGADGYMLVHKD